jgi:hypothetical protein
LSIFAIIKTLNTKEQKMNTQIVSFAPQNKLQVRALLKYSEENKELINSRVTSKEYLQEVRKIREILQAYFEVNPPQLKVKKCPWVITGAKELCKTLAEKYSVPVWNVYAQANPAAPL